MLHSSAATNRVEVLGSTPVPAGASHGCLPLAVPGTHLKLAEGWHKVIRRSHPATPTSVENRIALWLAPVQPLAGASAYADLLSSDDLVAINQIGPLPARSCAIAGRILLRVGLSHAVSGRLAPEDWRIVVSRNGKPVIGKGQPDIQFSVSHTDQVAAVAISQELPVGIDVESVEHLATKELIDAFCCGCEQASLTGAPAHQRSREFIRLWTLKEAYSKMIGLGHSVDFSSVGFSLDSLSLLHGSKGDLRPSCTHFETMWISTRTTLHHLSLAIDFSTCKADHIDLQVIAPSPMLGAESAIIAPSITLSTSGGHHECSGLHAL